MRHCDSNWMCPLLALVALSVACGTPPTGSPMLWSLDKAGYIRERDNALSDHYVTEADVVTIALNTLYLKYIADTEWLNLAEIGILSRVRTVVGDGVRISG